jgi:hypothetical protein
MNRTNKRNKVKALKDYLIIESYNDYHQTMGIYSSSHHGYLCWHLECYKPLWMNIIGWAVKYFDVNPKTISFETLFAHVYNGSFIDMPPERNFRLQLLATIIALPIDDVVIWFDDMGIDWNKLP